VCGRVRRDAEQHDVTRIPITFPHSNQAPAPPFRSLRNPFLPSIERRPSALPLAKITRSVCGTAPVRARKRRVPQPAVAAPAVCLSRSRRPQPAENDDDTVCKSAAVYSLRVGCCCESTARLAVCVVLWQQRRRALRAGGPRAARGCGERDRPPPRAWRRVRPDHTPCLCYFDRVADGGSYEQVNNVIVAGNDENDF